MVVNTIAHDPAERLRSYQLLADAFALGAAVGAGAVPAAAV